MTVQLIDTRTGMAVWGEELTRELAGAVSAQADITRMVASRLALTLSEDDMRALQAPARDSRAQDAYLRGLALRVSSPTVQEEAARAFREAVEVDPGFAEAWGQLALVETALAERAAPRERPAARATARDLAERALSLDPDSSTALAALGTFQFYTEWDFAGAEATFRRAMQASPSDGFVRQRFAMLLAALGRTDEAIAVARESQALEPQVAMRSTSLGTIYYYARDYARAQAEMRRALTISPGYSVAHFGLGRVLSALGRQEDAAAEIERALAGNANAPWMAELARVRAAAGRQDDVQRLLREIDARQAAGEDYGRDNLAYIAAAEGRIDDSFGILNEGVDERLANMLWIKVDPRVDPLRSDPRFDQLLRRMNLNP